MHERGDRTRTNNANSTIISPWHIDIDTPCKPVRHENDLAKDPKALISAKEMRHPIAIWFCSTSSSGDQNLRLRSCALLPHKFCLPRNDSSTYMHMQHFMYYRR